VVASPSHGSFGNEEDTWFGGDDAEAEARAEQSVAAVGARIIGAKPFPIAARRLEELTRNPKARLEQVVSVLETDPGLSVRLLRLVNSAGYGLKVRVTSVRHAAVLVGTRRLHQVATTAAILDLFETSNETAIELLEHAAVVGSLCRYLAVHLGLPHDELFTCGFLHDIGKLMLLDTEGDKYATLVRAHGNAPDQMHIQERLAFGFDHATLGAHVLTAWNIPEPVPKVVLYHHQPARAMQDTLLSSMVHTLRLADMMSYALMLEGDAEGIALVTESEAAQYLEISEPQVAAMWSDLRALADRSRARSHGQADLEVVAPRRLDVPRSLRPRRSGAPPRSLPPSGSSSAQDLRPSSARSGDVHEVPAHFPCVACSKPSYGNVCAACAGQVCPEHQLGPDHWCVLCVREYEKFRSKNSIPGYLKVTGLALAGFSVGASATGVMVSQTFAIWKLIVAPLTMVLLWGVLLPVAHRLWQRKRFLNTRPKGRVPLPMKLPRPNPVFISSLDANLDNEGLMGPSMPPPSQSGISIIAAVAPRVASQAPTVALRQSGLPAAASQAESPTANPRAETSAAPPAASSLPVAAAHASEESQAPSSEREFDQAAAELERSSEVMPSALVVEPERSAQLLGAAASLNPPSAAPEPAREMTAPPRQSKDSVAAHIAALLGEPSQGLSEFPSLGSAGELESVVASVSARLAREFPQNDYMGPSAELRAASLAPLPEPAYEPAALPSLDRPLSELAASAPAAPLAAATLTSAPHALASASAEPAAIAEVTPSAESVAIAEATSLAPSRPAWPGAEGSASTESTLALPIAEASPPSDPAALASIAPDPAPTAETPPASVSSARASHLEPLLAEQAPRAQLVFSRKSLEQGCAPRSAFRCAIPVAESCSPAPRRTSLRPSVQTHAVGETNPKAASGELTTPPPQRRAARKKRGSS
jgi:putative nucleotidyltransferase with HDIG domain